MPGVAAVLLPVLRRESIGEEETVDVNGAAAAAAAVEGLRETLARIETLIMGVCHVCKSNAVSQWAWSFRCKLLLHKFSFFVYGNSSSGQNRRAVRGKLFWILDQSPRVRM